MNLTEGQLFTIEALNRIEGLAWPEGMSCAGMFDDGMVVLFAEEVICTVSDLASFNGRITGRFVGITHPDWRNSLITREQFDSVDGWINNDNEKPNVGDVFVDVMVYSGNVSECQCVDELEWVNSDIIKWRYHKPTKESEMKDTEAFQPPIHETYYRYKKQRETTADARKALAASMEKEDKLLEQIKAWNLEYGFDIRVLDESDEVPESESELVITDWRDLRVGDVVEVEGEERVITNLMSNSYGGLFRIAYDIQGSKVWSGAPWKFIRRPSK